MVPAWVAKVERGKLFIADREGFDRFLDTLNGLVEVVVRQRKVKRSLEANSYLWSVVYKLLSDWSGHTVEEMHEICKQMFLPPHQTTFNGKLYTMRLTTASKSSKEFAEYVDRVVQFAAENGVVIPPPSRVDV